MKYHFDSVWVSVVGLTVIAAVVAVEVAAFVLEHLQEWHRTGFMQRDPAPIVAFWTCVIVGWLLGLLIGWTIWR